VTVIAGGVGDPIEPQYTSNPEKFHFSAEDEQRVRELRLWWSMRDERSGAAPRADTARQLSSVSGIVDDFDIYCQIRKKRMIREGEERVCVLRVADGTRNSLKMKCFNDEADPRDEAATQFFCDHDQLEVDVFIYGHRKALVSRAQEQAFVLIKGVSCVREDLQAGNVRLFIHKLVVKAESDVATCVELATDHPAAAAIRQSILACPALASQADPELDAILSRADLAIEEAERVRAENDELVIPSTSDEDDLAPSQTTLFPNQNTFDQIVGQVASPATAAADKAHVSVTEAEREVAELRLSPEVELATEMSNYVDQAQQPAVGLTKHGREKETQSEGEPSTSVTRPVTRSTTSKLPPHGDEAVVNQRGSKGRERVRRSPVETRGRSRRNQKDPSSQSSAPQVGAFAVNTVAIPLLETCVEDSSSENDDRETAVASSPAKRRRLAERMATPHAKDSNNLSFSSTSTEDPNDVFASFPATQLSESQLTYATARDCFTQNLDDDL